MSDFLQEDIEHLRSVIHKQEEEIQALYELIRELRSKLNAFELGKEPLEPTQ